MAAGPYSFIDIAVLEEVRARFAAGDALAILTIELDEVIWANGAGARLLGYADIEEVMGASPGFGLPVRRQIAAAPGFPRAMRDRPVAVRMASGLSSRLVPLLVSGMTLPDGEPAVLLASPAAGTGSREPADVAARIIEGIGEAGYFAALLDAGARIAAASPGFRALGLADSTLDTLVAEVGAEPDRLVKRLVPAASGLIPAGAARLTDDPTVILLIAVDEAEEEFAGEEPAAEATQDAAAAGAPASQAADTLAAAVSPAIDPEGDDEAPAPSDAEFFERTDEDEAFTRQRDGEAAGTGRDAETAKPDMAADFTPVDATGLDSEPEPAEERDPAGDAATVSPVDTVGSGDPLENADAALDAGQPESTARSGSDQDDWYFSRPQEPAAPVQAETLSVADPTGQADVPDAASAEERSQLPAEDVAAPATDEEPSQPAGETVAPEAVADRQDAESPLPRPDLASGPVRFVWRTDAAGAFSAISGEFATAVGQRAADVVGRSFAEVAGAYGLDPQGEIAGLMERRDTWSGRSVLWPIAGTDLVAPVDLAALPVYGRDRVFQGFRGFGVARMGDVIVDPDGRGLRLDEGSGAPEPHHDESETAEPASDATRDDAVVPAGIADMEPVEEVALPSDEAPAATAAVEAPEIPPARDAATVTEQGFDAPETSSSSAATGSTETTDTIPEMAASTVPSADQPRSRDTSDPFRGEVPVISIADRRERRASDKIIRLAERRPPVPPARQLSPGERNAFDEIRERLRKDYEAPAEKPADQDAPRAADPDEKPDAGEPAPKSRETRTDATSEDVTEPARPADVSEPFSGLAADESGAVDDRSATEGAEPAGGAVMHETADDQFEHGHDEPFVAMPDAADEAGDQSSPVATGKDLPAEAPKIEPTSPDAGPTQAHAARSIDDGTDTVAEDVADEPVEQPEEYHDEPFVAQMDAPGQAPGEQAIVAGEFRADEDHPAERDVLPAALADMPATADAAEDLIGAEVDDLDADADAIVETAEEEARTEEISAQPEEHHGEPANAGAEVVPGTDAPASFLDVPADASRTGDYLATEVDEPDADARAIEETAATMQDAFDDAETSRETVEVQPDVAFVEIEDAPDRFDGVEGEWSDETSAGQSEPEEVARPIEADTPSLAAEEIETERAVTAPVTQPVAAKAAPAIPVAGFLPSAFSTGPGKASVDAELIAGLPLPLLVHAGDDLHFANAEFLALTGYASLDQIRREGGLDRLFVERDADVGRLRLRTLGGDEFPVDAHLQSVRWRGGSALLLSLRRPDGSPVREARQATAPAMAAPAELDEMAGRVAEMRTIIDTATDGVVLIARDGTIRTISRPAEALFGFDGHEVEGKPFTSLFAIESQRSARDYLSGLAENGVASVLNDGREVIGREAQGRFIPLFMTIGRLPGDSGFCAVLRDITQWKRAEEELTQARALAERASSQKTEFLARVSHEIRTPLNAIIGFSELMMDERFGSIGSDRYRDYLRDINRSGNHVLDLVNDLLDISKIEAGEQEMNYEAVSLNDTLAESVAMMQPQANRDRVIIRSSLASRLPEVVADLRSVRQIALNLLSNAIRYTPAGGQVIVSTSYEPTGDVVMRVRDTGIGMSLPEIDQALKPFKQINALKRGRHDGTGLGLPLTKAMVEANRARFTISSTPGEGTMVEITFPSTRVLAD